MQVYAPVQIVDNRWIRAEGEFAVRVEAHDLEGWLSRGLIVEPGTQVVLLQRGRYVGTLPPGRHEIDGFLSRVNNFNLKSPAAAILISTTDTLIPLDFSQLRTSEGLPIDVHCQIVLNLANPEHFAFRLMGGTERVTVAELQQTLVDEVKSVLQSLLHQMGIEELYGNLDFKTQIEAQLQDELGRTLERSGLELVQLRFIDYSGEAYEHLRQMRGDIYMANREAEALAGRAEIAKRMRQTLTQERMATCKDATELEEFIHQKEHELGLNGLIRQHEMDELKRTFTEEQADQETARRHILERLELEYTLALRKLKLEDDMHYDTTQLAATLERERQEFAHAQRLEWERAQQKRTLTLEDTRTNVERRELEAQQDFREAKQGLELLREMKERKLEEERARRAMDQEDKLLEARLKEQELETRSRASIEALISTSNPEQARTLAELESMRLKGNLSEEQIIALAAEKSPEVARALAEKYRAQAGMTGERLKDMEERLKAERETSERHADRMERLMRESMGNFTRMGEAYAQASGSRPVFTTGAEDQARGGSTSSAHEVLLCTQCQEKNESHAHFCKRCGQSLKG